MFQSLVKQRIQLTKLEHPASHDFTTPAFNVQNRTLSNFRGSSRIWWTFCTFHDLINLHCALPGLHLRRFKHSHLFWYIWQHLLAMSVASYWCSLFSQGHRTQTCYPFGFIQGWVDFLPPPVYLFKVPFWGASLAIQECQGSDFKK